MDDREQTYLRLIRENRGQLRKICRVYGDDAADREDLRQEILLQLWRSLPSFRGDADAGTWLYRVALNTALSRRRDRETREEARLHREDDAIPDAPSRPDREHRERERLERLYAAIDRLEDADRALVLMYLDEKSYSEMAEVLGITENYVGVRLHRIRKRLSTWLSEEET
ncbi:MAG: sigma-70 family RNA polymerase sigma factor [Candidatus Palauibacterales bacterium]|nr:sigma-70 family RNA polymerase sigma factor [Candidatus Palauibacterales bacterium]